MSRRRWPREAALLLVLALLLLAVGAWAPAFLQADHLWNLLVDALPLLVAATGMTLLILCGQIDVSIGAQFAVYGVTCGLLARLGLPMALVVPLTLGAGIAVGASHGFLVTRARVPAIVATLASMAILRGALRWLSGGQWISDLPAAFRLYGLEPAAGERLLVAAALALAAAAGLFLRWTSAGRSLPATGCDPEAARLAGLSPRRVVAGAFAAMGAATAAAALLHFPRYPALEIEAGLGFELEVIAAVVVGGTSIHGGSGSLFGTWLGVLLLSLIGNVLVFLRIDPAWERAMQGAILLAAVLAHSVAQAQRTPSRA